MNSVLFKIPYKPILTSAVGGVLELYDLYIFGLLAPTISHLFFPAESKLISTLLGYLVFAIGFFFRPLGSIFLVILEIGLDAAPPFILVYFLWL